jgi:hypothetical protein
MTASAAILGMLPLAIGIGKGSETQAPMATAVIGGLATSTILTLFVVPTVYTMFDDLARFFRKAGEPRFGASGSERQRRGPVPGRDLARPELLEPSVEAIERTGLAAGAQSATHNAQSGEATPRL